MWLISGSGDDDPTITRYSGNHTLKVLVVIANTATITDDINNSDIVAARRYFSSVAFSNGGAAKAWSDGTDYALNSGAEGGSFTLTGIPAEYNGTWAYLSGWGFDSSSDEGLSLVGFKSITANVMTLAPVSNGSVSIPVWLIGVSSIPPTITGYSGNDTVNVTVMITNTVTLTNDNINDALVVTMSFGFVTFSNGSAAMSWSQGEEYDPNDSGGGDISLEGLWVTSEIAVGQDSAGNVTNAKYLLDFHSDGRFEMERVFVGDEPDWAGDDTTTGTYTFNGSTGFLYRNGIGLPLTVNGNKLTIPMDTSKVIEFTKQ
jgi:hypothetical protein